MADGDIQDYYAGLTGGLQGLGGTPLPSDWAPQATPITVNPQAPPDVGDAYALDTSGSAGTNATAGAVGPAVASGNGSTIGGILGGLGSWFGSGGTGQAAPAGQPGAAPGWQQGAIGLGLGLLSGNPFNKWGGALRGYQTGAAADLARQQQVNQYNYQQQQLGVQRGHLGIAQQELALRRELAYKPQVQFRQNEETGEWDALQYDPKTQTVRSLPMGQADKIAGQEGVHSTYRDPLSGRDVPFPPGMTPRARMEFRRDISKLQSDLAAGKYTLSQLGLKGIYSVQDWLSASRGKAPLQTLPSGVPAGAVRQQSNRGNVRWKVKDAQGRTLYYDDQGRLISQR